MDQQSLIFNFLLAPRFRIWRYLALILFFTIVNLNQVLVGYKDIIPLMGNKVYWIAIGTILFYIVTVIPILNIITRYLLSGKYILVISSIVLLAFLYTIIPNTVYCLYIDSYDLLSESVIIDNLSAFTIYILCISGVVIPIFLRNWIIASQHLNELKIKQESSQVEHLKEQINPASFFKTLNRSKTFVKSEPDKASAMLMKLGLLLRYQLYDCNRAQVLLMAEISFLRNFLELEKMHSSKFNYTITTEGNTNGIFIRPSVLLPYVQSVINVFDNEEVYHSIDIQFNNNDEVICIILKISGINNTILLQKELLKVRGRLNTLYKSHYELSVTGDKHSEETEAILQLDMI